MIDALTGKVFTEGRDEGQFLSYYRIYQTRQELFTVVNVQWFDLHDYDENKWLRGKDGQAVDFTTEENAIAFLNRHVKPQYIEAEYRAPGNPEYLREDSDLRKID